MEPQEQPTLDLGALVQGFLDDLRAMARPEAERDAPPEKGIERLRQANAQVTARRDDAVTRLDDRYRARSEAMEEVSARRRRQLEDPGRRVPEPAPGTFVVAGRITDDATGAGLAYVRVRAFDLDRRYDDLLGETRTDAAGYYRLEYDAATFDELDEKPETYVEVLDEDGEVLFTSTKSFVQKAGERAQISAGVEGARVPMSQKVGAAMERSTEARKQDLQRRERILARRPGVRLEPRRAGSGGAVPTTVRPTPLPTLIETEARPAERPARPVSPAPKKTPPAKKAPTATKTPSAPARKAPARKAPAGPPLSEVQGIGPAYRERLEKAGVAGAEAVAAMEPAQLAEVLDVGEGRAENLVAAARKVVGPPLSEVKGIGPTYQERLKAAGITRAAAVAAMEPAQLAEVLGVGEGRAENLVAEARRATKKA
ncbi:MAG: DUF4332 domain-containing protein [Rhodothermales bacterium]|nr:DUF4332 domain-containing protein [Rhodothermales bacterium]